MIVGSAIELYTTVLGWHLYNGFWTLLTATGIVVIPFLVIVVKTFLDARENGADSKELVRVLQIKLYIALAIVFLAGQPFINIHIENMRFSHLPCKVTDADRLVRDTQPQTEGTTWGNTGTTYDAQADVFSTMVEDRTPQAPLWWYIVAKVSQAISTSLKHELPCQLDIRTYQTTFNQLEVINPALRKETEEFAADCYRPALDEYYRLAESIGAGSDGEGLDEATIELDTWMGSDLFVKEDGYYNILSSTQERWIDPDEGIGTGDPEWGQFPPCNVWWDELRKDLLFDIKRQDKWQKHFCEKDCREGDLFLSIYFANSDEIGILDATDYARDSILLKNVLSRNFGKVALNNSMAGDGLAANITGFFATIGVWSKKNQSEVEQQVLKVIGPAIQSIILLLFIATLPLLLVVSLYSIEKLIALSGLFFSVIFWTYLFSLAYWMDNFLLNAMDKNSLSAEDWGVTMSTYGWLLNIMYIVLPLMFSSIIGIASQAFGKNLFASAGMMGSAFATGSVRSVVKGSKAGIAAGAKRLLK